ncbi:MAG: LmeA family phospholipid-binding protein [Firmicutes bacterium]|nr:LmeA family phospholipid-binding protein [Bacillota bacterium]
MARTVPPPVKMPLPPRWLYWVAMMAAILVLLQGTLPGLVAAVVERWVQGSLPEGARVKATVESVPPAKFLLGQIDRLELNITGASFSGAPVERIRRVTEGVQLEWGRFFRKGQVTYTHVGSERTEVFVGPEGMNAWLRSHPVAGFTPVVTGIAGGQIHVAAAVKFLGRTWDFRLALTPTVVGRSLTLRPEKITVDGNDPGPLFQELVLKSFNLSIFLDLPPDTRLVAATVEGGTLLLNLLNLPPAED